MHTNNRWYWQYNTKKCANERPTILDRDTLMCDNELMTIDIIRKKCLCINQDICKQLVSLLQNKRFEEAEYLLDHWRSND
jgi:hypothetical protein